MDEKQWSVCTDPQTMLAFLEGKVSDRKLRSFAVGCCRCIFPWLQAKRSKKVVLASERYADKRAALRELQAAADAAAGVTGNAAGDAAFYSARGDAWSAAWSVSAALAESVLNPEVQAALLRCVTGNPFRRLPPPDPAWLSWNSSTVVRMAEQIYEDRRWEDMPVLGDALEDAGCQDAEVLGHCRSGGEHTRGCFLVDWVLGKE